MGRGVDDGSTERLLVGSLIPVQSEGEEINNTGSLGRTPPRCRSPGPPRQDLKPSQIQHLLGTKTLFKKTRLIYVYCR